MALKIDRSLNPFGAVVTGWNPSFTLADKDVEEIRNLLAEFQLLVFRGQTSPSDSELVAFCQNFGELIQGSSYFGDNQSFPEILRVTNLKDERGFPIGTGGAEACDWHADYAYMQQFGAISFLDALRVPARGGRTYFANSYKALESLGDEERARLGKLSAYHDTLAADRNIRVEEARTKASRDGAVIPEKPSASHSVVIRNPATGRDALFINPMLTRYINEMSAQASHSTLERLFSRITADDNVYAHDWHVGDLVVWDNIGLVHRRDGFDPHETRSMRQLTTLVSN